MSDDTIMNKFKNKYNLNQNFQIIFTVGSKKENGKSTGVAIVLDNMETVYTISIYDHCSIYTAEMLAIEKVLWP